jgi:Carboxypeptidase regulatory-like domain
MVVALVAALTLGAASAAQQDTLARLDGTVSASKNGQPLAGVMVAVRGTPAFHVTDSAGHFRIAQLAPGRRTLRLVYQDRVSEDYDVVLKAGRTLELAILLDVGGVELAPIVVEAASQEWALSLAGFYARRGKGFGHFVTRDEIERRNPSRLSGLLAGSGIVMRCTRMLQCVPTRFTAGRRCAVAVVIDGQRVEDYNIDLMPLQDVVGIEVYRQGADTPVEFSRWSANCGAILIWTKN